MALSEDTEKILEAALNQAFSPPPSRRQSMQERDKTVPENASVPASEQVSASETLNTVISSESMSSPAEDDSWKAEYEEQVKVWRAQSAEAREKAEKVREQWEARRAAEREEAAKREAAGITSRPENLSEESKQNEKQTSRAQEVDASSKETGGRVFVSEESLELAVSPNDTKPHTDISRSGSQPDTMNSSQRWEEVNSQTTSSFPSMSFPEQASTTAVHKTGRHHGEIQQSFTMAVFDSSLSTSSRLKALASSLAVNLLLPFVNGVMLGFGEIFAKNFVLHWLGWGSTAANVGLGQRQKQPGLR